MCCNVDEVHVHHLQTWLPYQHAYLLLPSRVALPHVLAPLFAHALHAVKLCWLLVLPLFFLVPLLQYDVAHSLHLFFLVALLQYAVELCWLLVLPLFFLIPLLQYTVKLCQLLILPLFLLDPDVFSFD
jgi:hypothetical protein